MIEFSKLLGRTVPEGFDRAANARAAQKGGEIYAPLWEAVALALEGAKLAKGQNFIALTVGVRDGAPQTPRMAAVQSACLAWFTTPGLDYKRTKALKITEVLVGVTELINRAREGAGLPAPFPRYGAPAFLSEATASATEAEVIAASAAAEAKMAAKVAAKNAAALASVISALAGMTDLQVERLLQACAARLELDIVEPA